MTYKTSLKLATVVLVWFGAYAVDALWSTPSQADVDPAIAVRQLHSNEAIRQLRRAGRNQTSNAKSVYAVAAIVTTGICLDSVIARLSGRNHGQALLHRGSAEAEERQER